jgi:hypothetical protein
MANENHNESGSAHRSKISIRALTEREIERLEDSLGQSVNRDFLVHWVSQSFLDVVRLSQLPTARECRDGLLVVAREGRQWIEDINQCPCATLVSQKAELDQLTAAVTRFCGRAEFVANEFSGAIKPGRLRTPVALEAFLDRMIGIAKRAKILPSTPGRAPRSRTAPRQPPAFFNFVKEALAVARDVIKSSPLPRGKEKALSALRPQSDEALSKLLEQLRGRIGDYRESELGLVEWQRRSNEPVAKPVKS